VFELAAVLLSVSALASGTLPQAQLVDAEIRPVEVRTGEVFRLSIRIRAPVGYHLSLPDSLPATEALLPAGVGTTRWLEVATGAEDTRLVEVVYPLQALRPGRFPFPPLRTRLDPESIPEQVGDPKTAARVGGDPIWGWMELDSVTVASVLPAGEENLEPAGPLHLPETGLDTVAALLSLVGILGAGMTGTLLWGGTRNGAGGGAEEEDPGPAHDAVPLPPEVARPRLMALLEEAGVDRPDAAIAWEESFFLFRDLVLNRAGLGRRSRTSPEILAAEAWRETPGGEALRVILEVGDGMRFGGRPLSRDEVLGHLDRIRRFLEAGHV